MKTDMGEDVELLVLALRRAAMDTGERITLREAAARFGIGPDEFAEQDAEDEEPA